LERSHARADAHITLGVDSSHPSDTGARARLGNPKLAVERLDAVAEAVEAGRVATCLPFLLEAGYSARSAADHDAIVDELHALPHFRVDEDVERRAADAQRQLARAGHHRLPPVDLLVAALADRHGVGVLHYDHDYDLIVAKTDLSFQSVWLAAAGALA
jgi:predicted nucleic acid-binding protein